MRTHRTRRRHGTTPHLGALAIRTLQAAQRSRRLRAPSTLFQRSAASKVRGFGWIPRPWHLRSCRIFRWLRAQVLRVHRGRRWRRLLIQRWNVGFAVGAFARTVTVAVFKKKASAKKRKRRQQQPEAHTLDWRIQRIKDVKAGTRRRTSLHHDATLDTQIRGLA